MSDAALGVSPAPAASRLLGLELALHPEDETALWKAPAVVALRAGRPVRRRAVSFAWLDGPNSELAQGGRQLVRHAVGTRVMWCLRRAADGCWPPSDRAEILAEAGAPDVLGPDVPPTLTELARFAGVSRCLELPGAASIRRLETQLGTFQALEAEQAACRVVLEGSPREAFALARALSAPLRLRLAQTPFGGDVPERPPAPPVLGPGLSVDDALADLIAGLARALLFWAPRVGRTSGPEPVHQMRVALRRLRSALKLFHRAVPACPELEAIEAPLRALGQALGVARDWDVFLDGLGAAVGAAFPAERAVARLLREAAMRRDSGYVSLREIIDGASFRELGLQLAELTVVRPWRSDGAQPDVAACPDLHEYARQALRKRLRKALQVGSNIEQQPIEALHALRLECKRLRYAAEFMTPLFANRSARRFIGRLASLQERLGRLNDGVVAASLMHQLGGGAGRAFAAGAVRGYVAARSERARDKAERAWRRFQRCEPFWD